MLCLTSARYNMTALVLVPGADTDQNNDVTPTDNTGHYEYQQDPDSGAIVRVWVPDAPQPGDPAVPVDSGAAAGRRIPLMARGIIDGGIRVAGTTERYTPGGVYENIDFVSIKFPADVVLTKRDRITDIRNAAGILLWKEEEFDDSATVFDVLGVTPVTDPFGNYIENSALLQRAEVQ